MDKKIVLDVNSNQHTYPDPFYFCVLSHYLEGQSWIVYFYVYN